MSTGDDIVAALLQWADERQAAIVHRFFKSAPGEYGEGDCFPGITNHKDPSPFSG